MPFAEEIRQQNQQHRWMLRLRRNREPNPTTVYGDVLQADHDGQHQRVRANGPRFNQHGCRSSERAGIPWGAYKDPLQVPRGPTDVQARSMVRKRRVSDAEGWATPTTVDPCGDSGLSAKVLSRPPASRGAAWRPALRMASQGHGSGQAVGSIGRLWNPSVSSCRQSRVRTESSCFITSASSSPSGWQVQPSRATRSTRGNGAVESRNGHPQVPICMFEHCGIAAHQKGRAESGSRAGAKKKAASELSLRRTDREPGVTCS